jgi:hypothetical protein
MPEALQFARSWFLPVRRYPAAIAVAMRNIRPNPGHPFWPSSAHNFRVSVVEPHALGWLEEVPAEHAQWPSKQQDATGNVE